MWWPSPKFNKLQDFLLTHIWVRTAPRELRHRAGPFHAAIKQKEIETDRANETKHAKTGSLTNASIYKRICKKSYSQHQIKTCPTTRALQFSRQAFEQRAQIRKNGLSKRIRMQFEASHFLTLWLIESWRLNKCFNLNRSLLGSFRRRTQAICLWNYRPPFPTLTQAMFSIKILIPTLTTDHSMHEPMHVCMHASMHSCIDQIN